MPKSWDIVAYTYKADIYCPDCIRKAVGDVYNMWNADGLDTEGFLGQIAAEITSYADSIQFDRMDESTFDSGFFPKVVFSSMTEPGEFCCECHREIW